MRKSVGKALFIGCSIVGLAAPWAAQADSTPMADVGVLGGVAFANRDIGGHFTWGATAHYRLFPELDVGAYFSYFSNNVTLNQGPLSGAGYDEHYAQLAGEANYHFDALPGSYAGAKFGIGLQSTSLTASTTSTHFLFGPAVGYDYMLGSGVSIGGQINVLYQTSSPNVTSTNLLAVVKYNFG